MPEHGIGPATAHPVAMIDLLTFGETMLVMRSAHPGRLALGDRLVVSVAGAESTVAIGMSRLGHRSTWVGHVGDDDAGALVLQALRGEQVDIRGRVDADRPTGQLVRVARTGALTRVSYQRTGSAATRLHPDDLDAPLAQRPSIVHATGITAALGASARETVVSVVRRASAAGATVSFDVNLRSRLTTVAQAGAVLADVLPHLDVLFCGTDELPVLAAALGRSTVDVDDALHLGLPLDLVIKRGREGASSLVDGRRRDVDAVPVSAVDVVGAGDAFVAGYLSARRDGLSAEARLERGAAVAGFCVAGAGDWENLPTRAELALHTDAADVTDR